MIDVSDIHGIEGLPGWRSAHVETTGSTNADLMAFAKSGADAHQLWLTSGEQVAGRGRRGRNWVSPKGNFHGSLYLKLDIDSEMLGFLPLVAAVAVHRAIGEALGAGPTAQIKWPNDILIGGAKCCGMLLESEFFDGHMHIVIGCGINLVAHPDDTPYPSISFDKLGRSISFRDMFHYLSDAFARTLSEWNGGKGNATIRAYWLDHARGIGDPMTVNLVNSQIEGICDGIGADGALQLRLADGTIEEISAGDVFFPRDTK